MERPRLLLLGSGFGAFGLLKKIDLRAYDVKVVSRRNHFLFTPLLPSTTVGTVEFRTIIEPIRRGRHQLEFFLGEAEALDCERRVVRCRGVGGDTSWDQPYDVLVIAVGCATATFGVPGVAEHALFLKELADARRIRERLVGNLERASLPGLPQAERDRLLRFIAVGAGPTGVRFAAELYDLLVKDLPRSYPRLASHVRVTLLDAAESVLSTYEKHLQEYVAKVFFRRGIEVRTQSPVAEVGSDWVRLSNGERLPAGMILWCAGTAPNPFVERLDSAKDRSGRLLTDEFLQLAVRPGVYALGDCAFPQGQNLPQLAQVAEQQGRYLADCLNRRARGKGCSPFRWHDVGSGSYLGRGDAVVTSPEGGSARAGSLAYYQWRMAMWTQLVSVRNKVLVPLDRLRAAVFGRDLSKF